MPTSKPPFHDSRLPRRFWKKAYKDTKTNCWLWVGCTSSFGYPRFSFQGRTQWARRVTYETLSDITPASLEGVMLRDTCGVRRCVNPAHLKPGGAANKPEKPQYRPGMKDHCKRGHPVNEKNTYNTPAGGRQCRVCTRENYKERYAAPGPGKTKRVERVMYPGTLQSFCFKGHLFAGKNLYLSPAGVRHCRECRRERSARQYREKKIKAQEKAIADAKKSPKRRPAPECKLVQDLIDEKEQRKKALARYLNRTQGPSNSNPAG